MEKSTLTSVAGKFSDEVIELIGKHSQGWSGPEKTLVIVSLAHVLGYLATYLYDAAGVPASDRFGIKN